jgi:urease accessory protein
MHNGAACVDIPLCLRFPLLFASAGDPSMTSDWLVWQLADSAFPSGGFAHSAGLEAAVQLGVVFECETFARFLQNVLIQMGRGPAYFARAAWLAPEDFGAIDQDCDLFLNNHVANRSSRAQGKALLASASKAFADVAADDSPARWALAVRQERLAGHQAPAFGLVARAIGIPFDQMKDLFLFIQLRGCISAAVRLGIVGPIQAQQIQANLAAKPSATAFTDSPECRPVQINPVLDLMQMTQDRLYSRLFQS